MGYFSNGTEGLGYREIYCDKCVHDIHQDCPVWNVHLLRNYEEANNKKSILHMLIPIGEGGENKQCALFWKKEKP